jgi:hypothetical protein
MNSITPSSMPALTPAVIALAFAASSRIWYLLNSLLSPVKAATVRTELIASSATAPAAQ